VEYGLPPRANVSPECRDLLSKLLVADPRSRIRLDGIWRHPWFQQDLPPGVAAMNTQLLSSPATFDGPDEQVGVSPVCTQLGWGGGRGELISDVAV